MCPERVARGPERGPSRGLSPALPLALVVVLTAASGASCPQFLRTYAPPTARVLPPTATLADVMHVVNDNSARVQSLYTTDASISVPHSPTLRASLALDRPRRFRLRAETGLTGPEVDLGSNDTLFWFWVRRSQPPALYFCRHDQFQASAARNILPVEPEWLIEALGVTSFDTALPHRGPFSVGLGRLQVETPLGTPQGPLTKVTIVDASQGWVLAQHLYDERNQRLASAMASQHQRDPATGVTLPGRVEIQWPATQFSLTIDLASVRVNQLPANADALWVLPSYPGYNAVDLADPRLGPAPAAPSGPAPPVSMSTRRRPRLGY